MYIFINLVIFILFLNCIHTLVELNLYNNKTICKQLINDKYTVPPNHNSTKSSNMGINKNSLRLGLGN